MSVNIKMYGKSVEIPNDTSVAGVRSSMYGRSLLNIQAAYDGAGSRVKTHVWIGTYNADKIQYEWVLVSYSDLVLGLSETLGDTE